MEAGGQARWEVGERQRTRVWPGSLMPLPGCHSEGNTALAASRAARGVWGGLELVSAGAGQ